MKKLLQIPNLLLLAAAFFMAFQTNAQSWIITGNANANAGSFLGTTNLQALRFRTNNIERMVFTTDGKTGIGVAAPLYKLHVESADNFTTGYFNNTASGNSQAVGLWSETANNGAGAERAGYFRAKGTLGANMGIWAIAENGGTNHALYADAKAGTAGGASYGLWSKAASSVGTTAYAIYGETTGAGVNWAGFFKGRVHVEERLGIGTTSPGMLLSVAAPANTDAMNVLVGNVTKFAVRGNGGASIGASTTPPPNGLYVSGNVGIGEANPAGKFHINGAANNEALIVQINGDSKLKVNGNGSVSVGGISVPDPNGLYVAGRTGIGTGNPLAKLHVKGDANDEVLLVRTSDDVTRLKVTSNGGVSVGTTFSAPPNGLIVGDHVLINTTQVLDDYMLAVNGRVICEELKVKNSANWPDFVFAKDYKLPQLTEVESFIAQNQHLPGIPAAAEVEKEGIEIGDMNRRLLQKVEELTLYLIELEKKVQVLENRN